MIRAHLLFHYWKLSDLHALKNALEGDRGVGFVTQWKNTVNFEIEARENPAIRIGRREWRKKQELLLRAKVNTL